MNKKFVIFLIILLSMKDIEAQKKIAVADFKTPEGLEEIGKMISVKLIDKLAKLGEFKLIERKDLKKIMEEQKLQLIGIVDADKGVEIGKLAGADDIIIGEINYCDIDEEKDYYDGTYYTADVIKTSGKISAYMKVVDVHSGEITFVLQIDTSIEWTGYTNITEKEIEIKTADTSELLSEVKKLSAAEDYWWEWSLSSGDILVVFFEANDDIEVWIGLPDGRYYPDTYKKAIAGRIDFEVPSHGGYRVVIRNPSSWWSREVEMMVYCIRKRKTSVVEGIAHAISKTSERDKLKKKPKTEEQILNELIELVTDKWMKKLSGVRIDERFRIEAGEMEVRKLRFKKGDIVKIKIEVSGGRRLNFLVLSEDGYEKWCNFYRRKIRYVSYCKPLLFKMKINFLSEEIEIPTEGTYYFIFDNRSDSWRTRTLNLLIKASIL